MWGCLITAKFGEHFVVQAQSTVDLQKASQRQSAGDLKNGDNEQATSSLIISYEIV
jgi:hypothetical protein